MKKQKAFSLIELLVAMAIIAVLLGLVGFGISTAQRNSRDSQRRQKVADIKLVLEDYNTRFNKYPGSLSYNTDRKSITVEPGNNSTTVKLEGPTTGIAQAPAVETAPVFAIIQPIQALQAVPVILGTPVPEPVSSATTTANATVYCYSPNTTNGGYKIGAMLETGTWYTASTDGTTGQDHCAIIG